MDHQRVETRRFLIPASIAAALFGAIATTEPAEATTYVSAEPIPSSAIVGTSKLGEIEFLGYATRALWAKRLLADCHVVANILAVLTADHAIDTISAANTRYTVAAGGFQGVTDPSYVLTIDDSPNGGASAADIFRLANALGYALNQGSTAEFKLGYHGKNPDEFPIAYAVITFPGSLTGVEAQGFFNYLGTIDPALWSGANAGFTQINLPRSTRDDAMLFLIGSVSTDEFTQGLFKAASTTPGARYIPLDANTQPTVGTAGAAFPGNGWTTPTGGYLENLPASRQLTRDLEQLRQRHLRYVSRLIEAINSHDVDKYLHGRLSCE